LRIVKCTYVAVVSHPTGMRTVADGHIQVEVGDTSAVVGSVREAEPGRPLPPHQYGIQGAVMESQVYDNAIFSTCSSSSSMLHCPGHDSTPKDTVTDCTRDGMYSVARIGQNMFSEHPACNPYTVLECKGPFAHQFGARHDAQGTPQAESLAAEHFRHIYQHFPPDDHVVTSNGSVAGSLASELSSRRSRRRAPRRRAYKHASRNFYDPKRTVQAGCPETRPDGEIVPGAPVQL
jgi:hypothetical protein